jgi:hypothetical protein
MHNVFQHNQLGSKVSGAHASIQSLVKFLESADAKSKDISGRLESLENRGNRKSIPT